MADTTHDTSRTHPLVITAAVAVILTCLVALGVMTGVVPFSKRNPAPDVATTAEPGSQTQNALAPTAPGSPPSKSIARSKTTERAPAVGSTSPTTGSGAVGSGTSAQTASAPAPCTNCGTVVAVRTIKQQGDASMIGPAAGALLGGVLGNQIGSGSGRTIATVVGAGAGAVAGTEIERRTVRSTTSYVIDVRMDDGTIRHFSSPTAPAVSAGAKVKVVDGKLMHG